MENQITIIIGSACIEKNGKVLIAKRADDDTFYPGSWEFAGGKIEFGESPIAGTIREIKEELGLDVTIKNVLTITHHLHETNPNKQFVILNFYAEMTDLNQEVVLSHEHSAYSWIAVTDLDQYDLSPYTLELIHEIKKHGLINL